MSCQNSQTLERQGNKRAAKVRELSRRKNAARTISIAIRGAFKVPSLFASISLALAIERLKRLSVLGASALSSNVAFVNSDYRRTGAVGCRVWLSRAPERKFGSTRA
ncbi:hypothetical protein GCT13_01445 [Paraburkholderia sp. CNPSo 3157]|uniref:Uncharacterized protein n=1 Tax=Paraburkholderia franconis TaxID=2654983 RepID=A0A7X1N5A2_9BURK|nr:hypothetical protein [Paraburkholderia franconis]MPW15609.1 hypothetical protein [Paraburkholderia franconis]